jgi:hypothetical protein
MRRLRARVNARLAVDNLSSERIDFFFADAVVTPFPRFSQVGAGVNFTAVSATEKRFGRRLENNRAEMFPRNHGVLLRPNSAIFLKREYSADCANQQFIFLQLAAGERLTARR